MFSSSGYDHSVSGRDAISVGLAKGLQRGVAGVLALLGCVGQETRRADSPITSSGRPTAGCAARRSGAPPSRTGRRPGRLRCQGHRTGRLVANGPLWHGHRSIPASESDAMASFDRARCVCVPRGRVLHERASWRGPLACDAVTMVHPYGGRRSRWGALIHDRLPGLLVEQACAADRLLANHKRSDGE
jgi:hypothetical protein